MIITLLVGLIKGIASILISLLFPLQLLDFVLPSFVITPVTAVLGKVTAWLVWLFGYGAYSFFILTVITTIFAVPAFKFSLFIVHFMHKIKTFFR